MELMTEAERYEIFDRLQATMPEVWAAMRRERRR